MAKGVWELLVLGNTPDLKDLNKDCVVVHKIVVHRVHVPLLDFVKTTRIATSISLIC
jgi:hypothetical protein